MQKVRVLEHVRSGRWKVEWVDPNPGLVDYVKSANIICRWADHRAVIRDEQRYQRLREVSDRLWPGDEHPLTEAVGAVLGSTGEDLYPVYGVLTAPPDVIERVCARSGVERDALPDDLHSFVDRAGTQHLSFGAALHLAKAFAAMEPDIVLLNVDTAERKYVVAASEPAHGYLVPLVERWRAGWAIVRQWAGTDEQFLQLYATAAREIKQQFPQLKVGGPAFGYSVKFENGAFVPSEFVLKFLELCRRDRVPL